MTLSRVTSSLLASYVYRCDSRMVLNQWVNIVLLSIRSSFSQWVSQSGQTGSMRISMWPQPNTGYCLLSPLLAIWNRCGRKKGHIVTHLPVMCLWLQYKKWYALKAMISAPGCSVPVFPVWGSRLCLCVCICTPVVCVTVCVSVTCCFDVHLFNLPPRVRTVRRKVKTPLSQAYDFFSSSFQAVSGLVFTGCFICLIYVPCPDCCMGPACSSHMVVPHALMRCPISRNTNRVLRPSLWLYDVWTHKSFPQIPDLHRS